MHQLYYLHLFYSACPSLYIYICQTSSLSNFPNPPSVSLVVVRLSSMASFASLFFTVLSDIPDICPNPLFRAPIYLTHGSTPFPRLNLPHFRLNKPHPSALYTPSLGSIYPTSQLYLLHAHLSALSTPPLCSIYPTYRLYIPHPSTLSTHPSALSTPPLRSI